MADWYPPERPQSHRASSGARRTVARLAAPLTAVVVVVVVIVLLIWINGRGSGSGSQATVVPTASHQPVASPTHTSSAVGSPTPRPSHAHHTPTPHPTHHHATPSASPSAPAADTAYAPVSVLNNSRIHGLAHHVAAEVESRGWTVGQVGNLQGRVAETTVYYPPAGYAAAQHLAREFGQIQRLEPQSEGGLQSADLVLVVTRFWTG